jgi:chromate transporter
VSAGADPEPEAAAPSPSPGLAKVLRYFVGLGTWGFGGPIATVGYMQRELVERRGWLDRQAFLNGVALGQTMPGPLAAQVVMWVGYLEAGAGGALATAMAFILPSLVLVLVVAYFYVRFSGMQVVQSLFYGIAPAVMAVIAVAAVKLARLTDERDVRLWAITLAIFAVTALTGAEIALLFIGAGLLMIVLEAPPPFLRRGSGSSIPAAFPMLFSVLTGAAAGGTLVSLGFFFLKAGAFIFGSGLAIVPFLKEGVVSQRHWLTQGEFLDAVAIGLITPGPVVITAAFIGYLVGGLAGAAIATIAIFTPIYLGVVLPGRWFVRHQNNEQVRAFVKGATAAAAGAIAGATVVLTRSAVIDGPTAAILVASLFLTWRFKNKEPMVVLLAAAAGIVLKGA